MKEKECEENATKQFRDLQGSNPRTKVSGLDSWILLNSSAPDTSLDRFGMHDYRL